MPIHILLASDDSALATLIEMGLRDQGYRVTVKQDGPSGLIAIRELQPDLAILDFSLPLISGLEICRRLRSTQQDVTVILLDQVGQNNCAIALDSGADDYLTRPFSLEELTARVRLHLRRWNRHNPKIFYFQDLKIDLQTQEVYRGNRPIQLTPKEFDLLVHLISCPRQVVPRNQLMESVWGCDLMEKSNILEVYIRYLRLKLEANRESRLIHTIRGVGYVLRETFSKQPALDPS